MFRGSGKAPCTRRVLVHGGLRVKLSQIFVRGGIRSKNRQCIEIVKRLQSECQDLYCLRYTPYLKGTGLSWPVLSCRHPFLLGHAAIASPTFNSPWRLCARSSLRRWNGAYLSPRPNPERSRYLKRGEHCNDTQDFCIRHASNQYNTTVARCRPCYTRTRHRLAFSMFRRSVKNGIVMILPTHYHSQCHA